MNYCTIFVAHLQVIIVLICVEPKIPKEMRWGYWTQMKAEESLSHLKNVVFPGLVELADEKSSFGEYMKGAQCKINKAGMLIEACNLIDQMKIADADAESGCAGRSV